MEMQGYDAIIVSGGRVDFDHAYLSILAAKKKRGRKNICIIAADHGLDFLLHNSLKPDIVIGDFDSAGPDALAFLEKEENSDKEDGPQIIRMKPEKDISDTHAALIEAEKKGCRNVLLLGATGTRLDHVTANLLLLLKAKEAGMKLTIADPKNLIFLADDGMQLSKKFWGEYYISFFPLGEPVEGLTLNGFQYPLNDFRLALSEASLTISNRIVDDYAEVHFKNGDLVVMITTD